MHKRNIYSAIGVLLSVMIVIGGWQVTQALINRKERALLDATGTVSIRLFDIIQRGDEDRLPKLTVSEMAAVLQNWESWGEVRPHGPFTGQITMEQAIAAGEAGLMYFVEHGMFPAEVLAMDIDFTRAWLGINTPVAQAPQPHELFYSFWTVMFVNDFANVTLRINAVTGEIWSVTVYYSDTLQAEMGVEMGDIEIALAIFMRYLGLEPDGEVMRKNNIEGRATIYNEIASNAFVAVASRSMAKAPVMNDPSIIEFQTRDIQIGDSQIEDIQIREPQIRESQTRESQMREIQIRDFQRWRLDGFADLHLFLATTPEHSLEFFTSFTIN